MATKVKPVCRSCGTGVECFGDLCDDCFLDEYAEGDGSPSLAKLDEWALVNAADPEYVR